MRCRNASLLGGASSSATIQIGGKKNLASATPAWGVGKATPCMHGDVTCVTDELDRAAVRLDCLAPRARWANLQSRKEVGGSH